jgi:dTDP-4-dehydrorhamnose reductase
MDFTVKLLLTGANGLLGSTFQQHAPDEWELLCRGKAELDIRDLNAIRNEIERTGAQVLINCAAYTQVDLAESEVDAAMVLNGTAPGLLAQATAEAGIPLVHISTDFVFDGAQPGAYTESCETGPLSVYGHTKRIGENAVRAANPDHLIVRTAWLYGDRAPGFPHLLLRLAKNGRLRVVTDQTGSPTYAPHLVLGIVAALESGARGTIHLAGGGACTRWEWAHALMAAVGIELPIDTAISADFPTPAKRPANSVLSSEHGSAIVLPDWQVGIRDFVAQR